MNDPPPIDIKVAPPAPPEVDHDRETELWDAEEQSKKIPAQYANRLYVKHEGQFLRFVFGDQSGDEIVYRTAFVVPNTTAYEMGELITRMALSNLEAGAKAWREWVAANPEDKDSDG